MTYLARSSRVEKAFSTVIIIAGCILVVLLQIIADRTKPQLPPEPLVLFPVPVIHAVDIGMDSAASSLVWLNLIQQIGQFGGTYQGFVNDLDTITTLDPRFAYPYAFSALMGPALDPAHEKEALAIGEKGVERHIPDWEIPFYVGATYNLLKDRDDAQRYFAIAASMPDIPSSVRIGALSYGSGDSKRKTTRQIWESIYETTKDDFTREQASAYLKHLDILDTLEAAVAAYRRDSGQLPDSIDTLVRKGYLAAYPDDPFNVDFVIQSDGQVVATVRLIK